MRVVSCSARVVGFQVVRRCNSGVSGATLGRRPPEGGVGRLLMAWWSG
jgi:hypothetical protein